MIPPGGSAHLDLSGLAPGALHGVLRGRGPPGVGDAGDVAPRCGHRGGLARRPRRATSSASTMSPEQMDAGCRTSIVAFPRQDSGARRQVLAPTVLPDGTKQFDLTATIDDWEVVAGQDRQGVDLQRHVPGPTIKVDAGDHVRIVLTTSCRSRPRSTSTASTSPNAMDGVPDVTQDPVKPGESFTYDFVAAGPRGRHVPLARLRRAPGARRPGRRVPHRRRAAAGRRRPVIAGGPDGAQRRRASSASRSTASRSRPPRRSSPSWASGSRSTT